MWSQVDSSKYIIQTFEGGSGHILTSSYRAHETVRGQGALYYNLFHQHHQTFFKIVQFLELIKEKFKTATANSELFLPAW